MPNHKLSLSPNDLYQFSDDALLFFLLAFDSREERCVAAVIVAMSQKHRAWYAIGRRDLLNESMHRRTLLRQESDASRGVQYLLDRGALEEGWSSGECCYVPTEHFVQVVASRYSRSAA